MKKTIAWLFVALLALAAGVWIGGTRTYDATMQMMVTSAVDRDARAVGVYVDVLEHMKTERYDEASETLESWMDDVLIVVMEPSNYEYGVRGSTLARADSAYAEARAYREAFPRTSDRSFVDEMVRNVWAAGPPSQFP